MKCVILAGGFGTRIMEEVVPKPMVEVGKKPIIWHIMKIYSSFGIKDFVIALGYKSHVVKEYFANYHLHNSNCDISLRENSVRYHNYDAEDWNISLVETGDNSMTGGRLRNCYEYLKGEEHFCLTYGDGLCNVDISKVIAVHKKNNSIATVTAVKPDSRFGVLDIDNIGIVRSFKEKPIDADNYVNGGYMVLSSKIFDYLEDNNTILEQKPLMNLTSNGNMSAYKHNGFWQCMDTMRDKVKLQKMWDEGNVPWKIW